MSSNIRNPIKIKIMQNLSSYHNNNAWIPAAPRPDRRVLAIPLACVTQCIVSLQTRDAPSHYISLFVNCYRGLLYWPFVSFISDLISIFYLATKMMHPLLPQHVEPGKEAIEGGFIAFLWLTDTTGSEHEDITVHITGREASPIPRPVHFTERDCRYLLNLVFPFFFVPILRCWIVSIPRIFLGPRASVAWNTLLTGRGGILGSSAECDSPRG